MSPADLNRTLSMNLTIMGIMWCLVSGFSIVMSKPSTLRVAACYPGSVPYVTVDADGQLSGFDIGNYKLPDCLIDLS